MQVFVSRVGKNEGVHLRVLRDWLGEKMVHKKSLDKLENIIFQVLKKMDSQENRRGIPHARWAVQEEVCKRYMESFGMVG